MIQPISLNNQSKNQNYTKLDAWVKLQVLLKQMMEGT